MAIYAWCPKCGTEYSIKHSRCPKCGAPRPRIGRFRIFIQYNKKIVKKLFTNVTISDMKTIETIAKQRIIEGMYVKKQQNIEFGIFVKQYYFPSEKNNKKPDSLRREIELYNKYISLFLENKNISNIETKDIEKIKIHMLEKGLSTRTIQYAIHTVRHMINIAAQQGFFSGENPAKNVKIQKKDNRRIRFLTHEEAKKLLSELKKHSEDTYEMALLSLHTGMRFSEIANLTWQDIDFERDLIYIKDPKSSENRVAYMTKEIKKILINRKEKEKIKQGKLIFSDKNGKAKKRVSKTFERVVNKIGLNKGVTDPRQKVVFHTLRHTFASWLAQKGTPIYTIKELMGHKTLAMTERYSHLAPDSKKEAIKKVFDDF